MKLNLYRKEGYSMKDFMEDLKVAVGELLDELFLVIGGEHYE